MLIGIGFIVLGYVPSFFRAVSPSANPLGEMSRFNFTAMIGATLLFVSLALLLFQTKFKLYACIGFSLYIGLLAAYHLELQHDVAEMGGLQRKIWNQIINQVPDINDRVCIVIIVPDTVNVRRYCYVNDWDNSPDIPTRMEKPLTTVRAFNGVTWAENVALRLLYGTDRNSQMLLLYPNEFGAFIEDQTNFLYGLKDDARGVPIDKPYSLDQILLFSYQNGNVIRQLYFSYQIQGKEVKAGKFGEGVIRNELPCDKVQQHKMRYLLLRQHRHGGYNLEGVSPTRTCYLL
jgi:hypothetical protein